MAVRFRDDVICDIASQLILGRNHENDVAIARQLCTLYSPGDAEAIIEMMHDIRAHRPLAIMSWLVDSRDILLIRLSACISPFICAQLQEYGAPAEALDRIEQLVQKIIRKTQLSLDFQNFHI